jgi:hypothetical protein
MRVALIASFAVLFVVVMGAVALFAPFGVNVGAVLFWGSMGGLFFGLACGLMLRVAVDPSRI